MRTVFKGILDPLALIYDGEQFINIAYTLLNKQHFEATGYKGKLTSSNGEILDHYWIECFGYIVDYKLYRSISNKAPSGVFLSSEHPDYVYDGKVFPLSIVDESEIKKSQKTKNKPELPARSKQVAKIRRQYLELLLTGEYSITEILDKTDITDRQSAHRMIVYMRDIFDFHPNIEKRRSGNTHIGLYSLPIKYKERIQSITDAELTLRSERDKLVQKIKALANDGFDIKQIASTVDKSKRAVVCIFTQHKISVTKRKKSNLEQQYGLRISERDKNTIYSLLGKPKRNISTGFSTVSVDKSSN